MEISPRAKSRGGKTSSARARRRRRTVVAKSTRARVGMRAMRDHRGDAFVSASSSKTKRESFRETRERERFVRDARVMIAMKRASLMKIFCGVRF